MNEQELLGRLRELDRPADPSGLFRTELYELLVAKLDDLHWESAVSGEASLVVDTQDAGVQPMQRRAGALWVAAAAFLVVGIGGLLTWWVASGGSEESTEPLNTGTVTSSPVTSTGEQPSSDRASLGSESVELPSRWHPQIVVSDGDRLYVLATSDLPEPNAPPASEATLLAVNSRTGEIFLEVSLTEGPSRVAADGDAVWVAHFETGVVSRIDSSTGEIVARVNLELPFDLGQGSDRRLFRPNDILIGFGSVWVSTGRGAIARIDASTNTVQDIIALTPFLPSQLAVGSSGVWVATGVGGLIHIDATTGDTATLPLEDLDHAAYRVAVMGDDVYVAGDRLGRNADGSFRIEAGGYTSGDQDALSRIDPDTLEVLGSTVLDERVAFLGWVHAFFGALDTTGTFRHIEAVPELISGASETNWDGSKLGSVDIAQLGREAWLVDQQDSRLVRIAETGPAVVVLPFEIKEPSGPRPVPDDLAVSPDWVPLERGPLSSRWPAVAAWTGTEIVIWGGKPWGGAISRLEGGAAYRPETDTWRVLSESPLGAASEAGWVWTGSELVIWTPSANAAAWQPETNTWRTIGDWPLQSSFYRRAVWTGEEILDSEHGLIVDPTTGESRPIADPPSLHERASVVWADGYLVAVTGDGAYDLETDTWIDMPPSGLTPLATSGTWVDDTGTVIAADYEMRAAAYDPQANTWTPYPDVPLRFSECFPRVHTLQGRPIVEHCAAGIAVWDSERANWIPLAHPNPHDPPTVIMAGEEMFAWGDRFYKLAAESFSQPQRLKVGTSILDRPQGWTLVSSTGGSTIDVTLKSVDGATCTVKAIDAEARAVLNSYLTAQPDAIELTPYVGGETVDALQIETGQIDNLHHLVWAAGTTGVIDVACTDSAATEQIASHIWAPYQ